MRRWAIALGLLLATTAAVYLPAVDGEHILDDWEIRRDPLVQQPLRHGVLEWVRAPRPVTSASFALEAALGGLAPRGLHSVNIAIHLVGVVLAWLLARESLRRAGMARPDAPALAAASIFALHPMQTGAVAYVSQRSEALASALYLAALLLLLARDRARAGRFPLALGAVVLHAAALGSKPVAATLPVAWLLHAAMLAPPGEEQVPAAHRVRRRLPLAAGLLALSALSASNALAGAAGSTHAGYSMTTLDVSSYLATQLRVVPSYLRLLLWPAGQCGDWWVEVSRSWLDPAVVAGGLLLAAIATVAVVAAVRVAGRTDDAAVLARIASFGALFFLLALAPSSSLVPLRDVKAEHRVYLALLGPALAAAAAAAVALRRAGGRRAVAAGVVACVLVSGAAAAATWRRSAVWATNLSFWSDAAERSPRKARVLLNLGVSLSYAGRPAEAVEMLLRARDLADDGTVSRDVLSMNLVTSYLELGMVGAARDLVDAELGRDGTSALSWSQLAAVEHAAGRDEACERAATAALAGSASPVGLLAREMALKWMGMCRFRRGDVSGALPPLRQASQELANEFELYLTLGEAELRAGEGSAACAAFDRAAAVAPTRHAWWRTQQRLVAARCVSPR